jgi:hypothetical protein
LAQCSRQGARHCRVRAIDVHVNVICIVLNGQRGHHIGTRHMPFGHQNFTQGGINPALRGQRLQQSRRADQTGTDQLSAHRKRGTGAPRNGARGG